MSENEILYGKTILFVDDRPPSIKTFTEGLQDLGATVVVKRTINGAADLLAIRSVDFVVIDLFLDPPDGRFDKYKQTIKQTGTNQGQLFGFYLQDKDVHKKPLPYLYISTNPSWFEENEKEPEVKAVEKSINCFEKFLKQIRNTLQLYIQHSGDNYNA